MPDPSIRTTYFEPADTAQPGRKIAYHTCGDASLPVVFCVHGLSRNGRDFDYLAHALCDHYYVIAIDVAGRGKSDWLTDKTRYTYPTYFQDILALFAHLKITQCYWIGTSMGGILGMMMAALQPQIIKKLVINDIGSKVPREGLQRIVEYVGKIARFETRQEAESFLRTVFSPFGIKQEEHWQQLFTHTIRTLAEGGFAFVHDPAITEPFRIESKDFTDIKDVDLSAFWEKTLCPTLILRGKKSDILPESVLRDMAKDHAEVSCVEFDGVGHAPALMAPEQITVVRNWLN